MSMFANARAAADKYVGTPNEVAIAQMFDHLRIAATSLNESMREVEKRNARVRANLVNGYQVNMPRHSVYGQHAAMVEQYATQVDAYAMSLHALGVDAADIASILNAAGNGEQ